MGRTYLPDGNVWSAIDVELLSYVPVVSAVMGSVAGLPAINACLAHFNLMVKDKSQLVPGGPPVVKAALGYDITKEELGGDHNPREDQRQRPTTSPTTRTHAFALIRQFLSYLPSNVWEMSPRGDTSDDVNRREEKLLTLIPRNPRQIYDPKLMVRLVVCRQRFVLRDRPSVWSFARHRTGAVERLSGGRDGEQSKYHGGRHGRGGWQQGHAAHSAVRTLFICR
jgi:hypothetical protein